MRFMLLIKGDPPPEVRPSTELIEAVAAFEEDLYKAGALVAAEGLHSSVDGARVVYSAGKRTVVDGPFTEAADLVAGFYLIQVASKNQAIGWASRCPVELAVDGDEEAVIEIRQVAEVADSDATTEAHRAVHRHLWSQSPSRGHSP